MFTVFIADNFHYMDEDEWRISGKFATEGEALDACRRIVSDSLEGCGGLQSYTMFGDDPFIVSDEGDACASRFSAWDYAESIAREPIGTDNDRSE